VNLLQDVRFAIRLLVKDRLVTVMAVVALGLGIGANATVFTCVNAVFLRGLPHARAASLYVVHSVLMSSGDDDSVSHPDFRDLRKQSKSFESLEAFRSGTMNVSDKTHAPDRLAGAWITASTFETIGERAILGRTFLKGEDAPGAEPVVVLGHGVWTDRYGADPKILGRTIKVNEVPATVVGVMARGMRFPLNTDLWQPLTPAAEDERRDRRVLAVFGVARAGAGVAEAQAELSAIFGRLRKQYPETNKDIDAHVMPYIDRFNGGPIKIIFSALVGAVGFVLLIACANVANLLLARSTGRGREIAIRASVGAGRWRIVRQLLVESLIIAALAGLLGLGLALAGVRLFDRAVADTGKPYWMAFTMDPIVLGFLAAVCLGTAVLFGLAPALHAARADVHDALREGGRGGTAGRRARRFTSTLVVGQLALTVVLLIGAGLMIRSFLTLYTMNFGIQGDRVITMAMTLAERKYPGADAWNAFHDGLADRLAALPGVTASSVTTALPLGGSEQRRLQIEGKPVPSPKDAPQVSVVRAGPGYFETLELVLARGRTFTAQDGRAGAEVAIVNEWWVSRFASGANPLGMRIRLVSGDSQGQAPAAEPPWLTIVGVSPTVQQQGMQRSTAPDPVVFVPFRQEPGRFAFILARGAGPGAALAPAIREAVRAVDEDQPVYRVRTLAESFAEARWPYRVFGGLLGIFALIALLLSSVGIYAVTAYSVAQRAQEMGVRMALGATGGQLIWLVLRRAAWQTAIGLAVGLGAGFGLSRVIKSILVQSTADDALTYAAVVAIFVVVTLVACVVPSRRAARLDPLVVLKSE
jgi:predicted permease